MATEVVLTELPCSYSSIHVKNSYHGDDWNLSLKHKLALKLNMLSVTFKAPCYTETDSELLSTVQEIIRGAILRSHIHTHTHTHTFVTLRNIAVNVYLWMCPSPFITSTLTKWLFMHIAAFHMTITVLWGNKCFWFLFTVLLAPQQQPPLQF